jgi:hypothetical protein
MKTRIWHIAILTCLPFIAIADAAPSTLTAFVTKNAVLPAGGILDSQNGKYYLTMQTDCNLVLYERVEGGGKKNIWQTSTNGHGTSCEFVVQGDGNLVVYSSPHPNSNDRVWQNGFGLHYGGYFVRMQNDGNLVQFYGAPDRPAICTIWESRTNPRLYSDPNNPLVCGGGPGSGGNPSGNGGICPTGQWWNGSDCCSTPDCQNNVEELRKP